MSQNAIGRGWLEVTTSTTLSTFSYVFKGATGSETVTTPPSSEAYFGLEMIVINRNGNDNTITVAANTNQQFVYSGPLTNTTFDVGDNERLTLTYIGNDEWQVYRT